jgi:hypothetical protein
MSDELASFFRLMRRVLHTDGEGARGSPMMIWPSTRGVRGMDEEERDEEDTTLSIRHGIHHRGI